MLTELPDLQQPPAAVPALVPPSAAPKQPELASMPVSPTAVLEPAAVPIPPASVTPVQPVSPLPTHNMTTRLRDGIQQPKVRTDGTICYPMSEAHASILSQSYEPTCFTQAVKHSEWHGAMAEEFNALVKNNTWTLVPRSPSHNTVGCKWVFRIKRHSDGSIERYKARLVAKGFHQQPGLDYDEKFNPVVKLATIRTVLCLAVTKSWPLRQLDIKNAFLNGILREEVYMTQPPGFEDPQHPQHVCRLQKSSLWTQTGPSYMV